MKKAILILLVMTIALSLAGCGKKETSDEMLQTDETTANGEGSGESSETTTASDQESDSENSNIEPTTKNDKAPITEETSELSITTTPGEEEADNGVQIEEGLLNVTITLPASYFEDMTDFDPEDYSKENGFKETVVNEDGSVSITMSKSKHNEILDELKDDIDKIFMELIEAENTPYIKAVTSSKKYRTVTVDVVKAEYEVVWDFSPLQIGIAALMYQQFDGTELHCEIIIRDVDTGETIKNVIYPDAIND